MSFIRSSHCDSSQCVEIDFRKATACAGGTCVEVGFHKSVASSNNGSCVEVKTCTCDEILVRDSKDPDGPVLSFTRNEWAAFLVGVKGEEFELPVA